MSLVKISNKYYKLDKISNPWIGSKYEYIRDAGTDITGKIGEEFIYELFLKIFDGWEIFWDKDKNTGQKDGVYDIKLINSKYNITLRIEVKTATQGKDGGFQHEKILGNEFCDKLLFLDINPNDFYITILDVNEIDFNCNEKTILGRKLHKRSNSDQTKLDFGDKTIKNGLKLGKTIYITDDENLKQIKNLKGFLIKSLTEKYG
jgi:hypothetical protein